MTLECAAGDRVAEGGKRGPYYTEGAGAAQAGEGEAGGTWAGGDARVRIPSARHARPGARKLPCECRGRDSNPHAPKDSGF